MTGNTERRGAVVPGDTDRLKDKHRRTETETRGLKQNKYNYKHKYKDTQREIHKVAEGGNEEQAWANR